MLDVFLLSSRSDRLDEQRMAPTQDPHVVIWRPPLVAEIVLLAMRAGEEELFAESRVRLQAIEAAVDLPPLTAGTYEASVAGRAAEMCFRLLAPDLLPDPYRLVAKVLAESLERSGADWHLDGVSTSLGLQAWDESDAPVTALADYIERHMTIAPEVANRGKINWKRVLQQHRADEVRLVRDWLTTDPDEPALLVYVSGPWTSLQRLSVPHVEMINHNITVAIEAALSQHPSPCNVRLVHPSLGLAQDSERTDREWLLLSVNGVLAAAGLILTDVAQQAPGFGAGVEAMVHAVTFGPAVVALDPECKGHSRFESALLPELRAEILRMDQPGEVAAQLASWFDRNFERMLAAARRRSNKRVMHHVDHQRLLELITSAPSEQISWACERSGLTIEYLTHVANNIDVMLATSTVQLDTFRRTLIQRRPVEADRSSSHQTAKPEERLNQRALFAAAKREGWPQDRIVKNWHNARVELARAGSESRLYLPTEEAWISFDARTYRG